MFSARVWSGTAIGLLLVVVAGLFVLQKASDGVAEQQSREDAGELEIDDKDEVLLQEWMEEKVALHAKIAEKEKEKPADPVVDSWVDYPSEPVYPSPSDDDDQVDEQTRQLRRLYGREALVIRSSDGDGGVGDSAANNLVLGTFHRQPLLTQGQIVAAARTLTGSNYQYSSYNVVPNRYTAPFHIPLPVLTVKSNPGSSLTESYCAFNNISTGGASSSNTATDTATTTPYEPIIHGPNTHGTNTVPNFLLDSVAGIYQPINIDDLYWTRNVIGQPASSLPPAWSNLGDGRLVSIQNKTSDIFARTRGIQFFQLISSVNDTFYSSFLGALFDMSSGRSTATTVTVPHIYVARRAPVSA
jgi:hypothetical protein